MESELLRCPFCDGEGLPRKALRDGYIGDWENDPDAYAYFIICRACACQGGWAKSEGGAIKLWNLRVVTLSPACPEPKPRDGQDKEPDHKAMWKELLDRDDTSLALRDVMKEICARHTPCPEKDTSRKSRTKVRDTDVRKKPEEKVL